jgi:stearoyl-CoA desaturase (delta-9 desaturase)
MNFVVKFTTLLFLIVPPIAILGVFYFALTPKPAYIILAVVLYLISMAGVTIGFHRLLTHRGFKANKPLLAGLTIAGCTSLQGSPIGWVALHRRHHQLSDQIGDPHSPHNYGEGAFGVARGFWHAHAGWLFAGEEPDVPKYAPDMLKDKIIVSIDKYWALYAAISLVFIPGIVGFLVDGWIGMIACILWAGIIRAGFAHHVAWSVNSVCHLWGKRPFETRDEARNVAWLAPLSLGESFHNAHHAYPASPRHGLLPHQWDASARVIKWFEKAGWATNVKWYTPKQIQKKLIKQ